MINSDTSNNINIPNNYSDITSYVISLCSFINKYKFMINIHIVDFLTKDQWSLIDLTWRQALLPDTIDNEDLWWSSLIHISTAADMTKDFKSQPHWPASFCEFIQDIRSLSIGRYSDLGDKIKQPIDIHIKPGMTEKKIHEVERMGALMMNIGKKENIKSVVDLGAGQGYLSRTMAYQYDFQVIAVDESEVQTCGAKRFDDIIIKGYKHKEPLLHHVKDKFTNENATDILSSIKEEKKKKKKKGNEDKEEEEYKESWMVCGLHSCGQLSPIMLRLFIQQPDIHALVNVGCCYHFLTHNDDDRHHDMNTIGFPMSDKLKDFNFYLGSTACMLACQTPSRWLDQRDASIKAFEHHFFRALFHWLMIEKGLITLQEKAPKLGRLNKKKDFDSFPIYVKAALKKLKINPEIISIEESLSHYHRFKNQLYMDKRIAVLWTIRALLGPVIESLILVDRYLYLNENIPSSNTKKVWLQPLFDSIISPRNMVIMATK